ncbi:CgeB family protein [Desulfoplanes formicivorans]|nr:glycosyltransferase [Desulfoplanes formicivorans]
MTTSSSLRVLVILPFYGGSLPIGRYCVSALRSMGHLAEPFEAPDFFDGYNALETLRVGMDRLEYLQNSYLQLVSTAVLAKVETFEPDLVLALAQAPLSRQALKRLRRDRVPTVMWFVEDYSVFTYWRGFAPLYDYFAIIQKQPFEQELEKIGVTKHLYLPLAAQPDFHQPVPLTPAEQRIYGSDISFLGAGYPNRRLAFRELLGYDFKIWGNEWDGESALQGVVQRDGARISPQECVKIFNATKINLNLHSSIKKDTLVGDGDFVNPRTFELACCGGFQLVDRRSLLPELFAEDEMATFGSMEELFRKIDHFLAHPQERERFAKRARDRVLRDHTYAVRMQTLIDYIAADRADWPARRDDAAGWATRLDEDLRSELKGLLERLQLPLSSSFKDIVWAIRQQQGRLSRVETAILFLDEWKKQYGGEE